MEFLKPPSPNILRSFSTISVFPPQFSLQIGSNNRGRRFRVSKSANPLFTHSLAPSTPQSFRLSAHFGSPIRRRNSLRKKLVDDQKVRQKPLPLETSSDYQNPHLNFNEDESRVDDEIRVQNLGNSNLLTKLENWVDQCKRDIEFWGIGTEPIFTVLEDLDGNVREVNVNEDEIVRRSIDGDFEFRESSEVNSRILYAKDLAREIEKGGNLIPRNSSVAKFVVVGKEKLGLVSSIQDAIFRPDKVSKVGGLVICYVAVFLVAKKSFGFRNREVKQTRSEKEMENGDVEVIQEPVELPNMSFEKPKLDRQELMDNILKAKASKDAFILPDRGIRYPDFDHKIEEIRAMARQAREIERRDRSLADKDEKEAHIVDEGLPNETEVIKKDVKEDGGFLNNLPDENARQILDGNGAVGSAWLLKPVDDDESRVTLKSVTSDAESHKSSDTDGHESFMVKDESPIGKPKVIMSVKEAREFLSKEHDKRGRKQAPLTKADKESVTKEKDLACSKGKHRVNVSQKPPVFHEGRESHTEKGTEMDSWTEKNFHEVGPVLKKIGDGFRDNYVVAREKADENLRSSAEISELRLNGDDNELEWMADDRLREIVFQVRDNELAGRDPFYLMDAEDKAAFFQGLEKKVEKENEKLSHLHQWLHSNIENLDYGSAGISLHDPPEKAVPRWKGPPLEKNPEFLDNFLEQRKALFSEKNGVQSTMKTDDQNLSKISSDSDLKRELHTKDQKKAKTVIESSDGSTRPGKKSGKEYWEHTKKWSRGFLHSYNAETDPETKSIMRDIGKDLDRWITEEEIEETKDLISKVPAKQKQFIEKKLDKLKREMKVFGPQAVVSKYREYAEDEEEDYLWWLDLPHVLCIELYTTESEKQKIGFYALEMAGDLDLEPKPVHVIAFEDAGDCRNFCYIVQSHLEMLGNGHAFIVPRPPKDAFREAKENGLGVTVIRKREIKLNVDQTLEEVEEVICEIGSKMYYDKVMRKQSVDINTIMKGVLSSGSSGKPKKSATRKSSKKALKTGTEKQRPAKARAKDQK